MEKLIKIFKRKYRIVKIENVYFVQVANGILPWRNKYVTTNKERAMEAYRLLKGTREIIEESV